MADANELVVLRNGPLDGRKEVVTRGCVYLNIPVVRSLQQADSSPDRFIHRLDCPAYTKMIEHHVYKRTLFLVEDRIVFMWDSVRPRPTCECGADAANELRGLR